MVNEITIPALPCISINETLIFYVAMGFEITYQQERPNTYACVKRDDVELHFFAMKNIDPANSYSTCLVIVENAEELYQSFIAGLRQQYGKLPAAGVPRITKPNDNNSDGDLRFNVIDPSGNWIRFIEKRKKIHDITALEVSATRLSRAMRAAKLLMDSKGDYPAAAKILDVALERDEQNIRTVELVQALTLRVEIAANMNELILAQNLLNDIRQISLSDAEKTKLVDELQHLDELSEHIEGNN